LLFCFFKMDKIRSMKRKEGVKPKKEQEWPVKDEED